MATLNLYQAAEGGATLLEYHSDPYTVVILAPEALFPTPRRFRDVPLALLASTHLVAIRDTAFQTIVSSIVLGPGYLRRANENGTIHVVLTESSMLDAGDILRVTATVKS